MKTTTYNTPQNRKILYSAWLRTKAGTPERMSVLKAMNYLLRTTFLCLIFVQLLSSCSNKLTCHDFSKGKSRSNNRAVKKYKQNYYVPSSTIRPNY